MATLTLTVAGISANKTKVDITWHYKTQSLTKRYHIRDILDGIDDADFDAIETVALHRIRTALKNAGTRDLGVIKNALEAGSIEI